MDSPASTGIQRGSFRLPEACTLSVLTKLCTKSGCLQLPRASEQSSEMSSLLCTAPCLVLELIAKRKVAQTPESSLEAAEICERKKTQLAALLPEPSNSMPCMAGEESVTGAPETRFLGLLKKKNGGREICLAQQSDWLFL